MVCDLRGILHSHLNVKVLYITSFSSGDFHKVLPATAALVCLSLSEYVPSVAEGSCVSVCFEQRSEQQ